MSLNGYIQKSNSFLLAFHQVGLNIELPCFQIRFTNSNMQVLLKLTIKNKEHQN